LIKQAQDEKINWIAADSGFIFCLLQPKVAVALFKII
jgi:hypothetical protein